MNVFVLLTFCQGQPATKLPPAQPQRGIINRGGLKSFVTHTSLMISLRSFGFGGKRGQEGVALAAGEEETKGEALAAVLKETWLQIKGALICSRGGSNLHRREGSNPHLS